MKQLVAIVIALLMSTNSYSQECPQPVQGLDKGASANCRGYLFSPEKELQVRLTNEENKLLKEELNNKKLIIDRLYKINNESETMFDKELEKSNLWKSRAEDSTKKLLDVQGSQSQRDLLFVIAGVLLTVGAGYAIGQAAK